MSREVRSSRCPAPVVAVSCAAVLLFGAANIAAQGSIVQPQPSPSTASSSKRQRIATMQASDSLDGSRVALSSDQSLNDYEAYRDGDRFYVKIPPADVPRAETVRGRGFNDVKVERGADSTVVSFGLQPGATARVVQYGNRLDVVFTMADSNRRITGNTKSSAQTTSLRGSTNTNSNYGSNSGIEQSTLTTPGNLGATLTAQSSPSPMLSPEPEAAPAVSVVKSSPATASTQNPPAQGTTLSRLKERARHWLLLAQLNPLPVAIGAGVLLLLIGLLLLQRRRAKAARDPRPWNELTRTKPLTVVPKAVVVRSKGTVADATETAAAVCTTAAASVVAPAAKEETPAVRENGDRNERVIRVLEEVQQIMAGGDYDESIIASDDPDTRKLVGGELLSALVGRNVQRRERARAAFMKHGYFDDATLDLRTADSANERAAAARRLSFVQDREATPHLIGGLDDPSPDVRRASVEALMDLKDPAAIAPLNSLMQTETDRKVPRTLLKQAIEACATGGEAEPPAATLSTHESISQSADTEREVIVI
jgi:HEAT repeats